MAATSAQPPKNPPLECASLSLVHNWLQQYSTTHENSDITTTQLASVEAPFNTSTSHAKHPVINIKPLALCLANHLPQAPVSISKRRLVDGYIQELQTRAPQLHRRPVTMLHWHNPLAWMDKADITEIMYHLGRSFRLSDHEQADYCVRLYNDTQKEDAAALFKGLGFNRLEIVEPPQSSISTQELRNLRSLADDYHYQQFQLTLEEPCVDLHKRLQLAFNNIDEMPDLVRFHSLDTHQLTRLRATEFNELLQGMRDCGYRIIGNDCFVKAQHELACAQSHHRLNQTWLGYNSSNVNSVLGIGPGNISQEGWHYNRNPNTLEHYLSASPEQSHTEKPRVEMKAHAKLITSTLLSYHRLDLKYLADRYDLHPRALLDTHQHHLTQPLFKLFNITEQHCQLTLLGVTYLEEICDLFMRYTPNTA